MEEQARLLEMLVGQLDKRLGSIEQHLAGFHPAILHVRDEVAQVRVELGNRIDQLRGEVGTQIHDVRGEIAQVRGEIAQVRTELGNRIDQLGGDIRQELRQIRGEMETIRAEGRSHLRWSLAGMFTLFGAAGPLWMWVLSRIIR
jgi:chromosome segregation ATPase